MGDMGMVQEKIKDVLEVNKLLHNVETSYFNLADEVNEVGKELLQSTNYGKNSVRVTKKLKDGVGRTILAILALCNSMGVSGRELSLEILSKYEDDLYDK